MSIGKKLIRNFVPTISKEWMMNKFFSVFFMLWGAAFICFSAYQGLALAGIFTDYDRYDSVATVILEGGPVIQGYAGGLIPTVFALFGAGIFIFGWRMAPDADTYQECVSLRRSVCSDWNAI